MFPRKRQRRPSPPGGSSLSPAAAPAAVASQSTTIASGRISPSPASQSSVVIPATAPTRSIPVTSSSMPSSQQRGDSSASTGSTASSIISTTKAVRKTRSWYGTWPRMPQAQASTQLNHEFAVSDTLRAAQPPDFTRFKSPKTAIGTTPGLVEPDLSANTAQMPSSSTETLKAIPNSDAKLSQPKLSEEATVHTESTLGENEPRGAGIEAGQQQNSETQEVPLAPVSQPSASASWYGWFASTSALPTVPEATMSDDASPNSAESNGPVYTNATGDGAATVEVPKTEPAAQTTGSWFGLWGSSATPPQGETEVKAAPPTEEADSKATTQVSASSSSTPVEPGSRPSAGSTWAFWSRDTGPTETQGTQKQENPGELAVIGAQSEAHPQQADGTRLEKSKVTSPNPASHAAKAPSLSKAVAKRRVKRLRPQSSESDLPAARKQAAARLDETTATKATALDNTLQRPCTPSKTTKSNLLLPCFSSTYGMKNNPSIIQQIAQFLMRTQQPPAKHVFMAKEPPQIKKAVAIGVHGWFPATYLRPMIGQPTGTSIRFMNHGADAIRKWAESHGCGDVEIEKIALEGDGKIGERVDNLWKLLLNWIDHIRQADLIIVACHSQGVPVGIMLVAKLIELGVVSGSKIGICAMAGVCLGPFADYKSSIGMFMGSTAELWEFGDPESEASKRLERALQVVLDFGGRITFIGSMDDQVVPLESAIYSPANHPYIFRAVFIDGMLHTSDFISQLVGFALKLRNLGISDHGLIRELSMPLAGSLYTGEGHSKLYDEQQVYDLAVSHALDTTDVPQTACHFEKRTADNKQSNPFVLPWIMRGLLEENFVKTELSSETNELLNQFDSWEPSTKPLKDVKFRLEAVRSKL